jgi:hypothetical protein
MLGGADWWREIGRGTVDEHYGVPISEVGVFTPRSRAPGVFLEHYQALITVGGALVAAGDGLNAVGDAWDGMWDLLP